MGKVKDLELKKKDAIEHILINLWANIGMDIPSNYEVIVQDCYEDVCECADPVNWHNGDVAIAFRRWIEAQTQRKVDAMYEAEHNENVHDEIKGSVIIAGTDVLRPKPYFEIMKQGWDEELQREEIQIHGGEHANIFIVKTEEGFVIDVYGTHNDDPTSMTIWEDDLFLDEGDDEVSNW